MIQIKTSLKNEINRASSHPGHVYFYSSAPLTALGACWPCVNTMVQPFYLFFYTYLFLSVLFKAHDLKCCLLLGPDVFARRGRLRICTVVKLNELLLQCCTHTLRFN